MIDLRQAFSLDIRSVPNIIYWVNSWHWQG